MNTIRDRLTALPFVGSTPSGGLNYWQEPPSSGNPAYDRKQGRYWAAFWVDFLRGTGLTALHVHLNRAILPSLQTSERAKGFAFEIGETIRQAPPHGSAAMLGLGRFNFNGDPAHDLPLFPWVRLTSEGANTWVSGATGDPEEDRARGRFYGAVLCRYVQQTGNSHVMAMEQEVPASDDEIVTGMCHVIAEMVLSAPPQVTPFQKAAALVNSEGADPADLNLPEISLP